MTPTKTIHVQLSHDAAGQEIVAVTGEGVGAGEWREVIRILNEGIVSVARTVGNAEKAAPPSRIIVPGGVIAQ